MDELLKALDSKDYEKVITEIDKASETLQADLKVVHGFDVKPGKTIKAMYAALPIKGLSCDFLVQVTEPIALIPIEKRIGLQLTHAKDDALSNLKKLLLDEWYDNFKDLTDTQRDELKKNAPWALEVNKVELIECDLLTPRIADHESKMNHMLVPNSTLDNVRRALQIVKDNWDYELMPDEYNYLCSSLDEIEALKKDISENAVKEINRIVEVFFENDQAKMKAWFNTESPLLGGISPYEMIGQGRSTKLLKLMQSWTKGEMP